MEEINRLDKRIPQSKTPNPNESQLNFVYYKQHHSMLVKKTRKENKNKSKK